MSNQNPHYTPEAIPASPETLATLQRIALRSPSTRVLLNHILYLERQRGGRVLPLHPLAEELAALFHQSYEALAPLYKYDTRPASAVPWAEVPQPNKDLMIATADAVLRAWGIDPPTVPAKEQPDAVSEEPADLLDSR